jgi:hypothetical protein
MRLEGQAGVDAYYERPMVVVVSVGDDGRVVNDGSPGGRAWAGRLLEEVLAVVVKRLGGVSMHDL